MEKSTKIIEAAPLRLLSMPDKFNHYIFCDIDIEKTRALEQRIATRGYTNTTIINCDANNAVPLIKGMIPSPSASRKTLHFCLLDIYGLSNLHFATLKELSLLFVDFLVLIPSFMDANRFLPIYIKPTDTTVERFLGIDNWRDLWNDNKGKEKFGNFIVDQFSKQMGTFGYLPGQTVLVRSDQNNLPLYHLVVYSRHIRGTSFWKQAIKYANPQTSFLE
jgi:three-Cys-motif partner protein